MESSVDRFPRDTALRFYGYRIHSRPKSGEPVWELDGQLYRESEAVKRLGLEESASCG